MTNDNPKCPVCLTAQSGAHTCKRAKPLPSEPECRRLRESGNDLGSVYVPEPKCEHEERFLWRDKLTNETQSKTAHESCPFCKPVEPSCEHDRPDQNAWVAIDRTYSQSFHVECPICKPVEHSVEEKHLSSIVVVKGNHPLAEIIARKLFSIERVPKKEQSRMVNRAIKAAVAYHEEALRNERNMRGR